MKTEISYWLMITFPNLIKNGKDGFMKRKKRNERDIQRADLIGECDQNDKRNPNRSVTRRSDTRKFSYQKGL